MMEHTFNVEVAKKYGVNAAILYRNFQFWIAKNKADGRHYHEGRTWTYNTRKGLCELFPYLGVGQIRGAIEKLVEARVLRRGNFNKTGYDRTTWYAFEDEKAAFSGCPAHWLKQPMTNAETANGTYKSRQPIPIPKPDRLPHENNNNGISSEERLDLDLEIADAKKFFMEQVSIVLKPRGREVTTFANIARYLVRECQGGRLRTSIFKDAVEWARQAAASTATNKKGLFVAKLKEETGFGKQKRLLQRTSSIKHNSGRSVQEQKRLLGVV